ncbi:MAG TPA: kelch repeat-containing protein [Chitinophagaceae bacterium]|nr:kelch repeat-containing protein [Chitinophagaceae bacterium]
MKHFPMLLLTLIPFGSGEENHAYTQEKHDLINLSGSMRMPRAAHTATLLKNGKVLVCGGFSKSTSSTAEIYIPSSKTFQSVGNMGVPRSGHSATLLPNGKVLIAGGYNGNYLSSAEIFDPATETFTSAGIMTTARSGHTATVLNNGKILFVGGVGIGWSFLQSAELYDIRTGIFSATGSMTSARESHTATLLENGTVLITGGHKGRRADIKIYSSAEIYDPSSEKFTLTSSMAKIRHKHDAVMLKDGKVLIIGGSDERDSKGAYTSTEIYNPVSATFQVTNNMNLSRYKHNGTSILLENGNILIAGGANRAETYNSKQKEFAIVSGDMMSKRLFSCATLLTNGQVLITGGYDENIIASANSWIYSATALP